MMNSRNAALFVLALFLMLSSAAPQLADPATPIPIYPELTLDRLNNGLTYYIRPNHQPENRAELRLVVNAGSIVEDDDQQGLAHFVEHMAFNGTDHHDKGDLVDYLEKIGMGGGAHFNAATGADETIYMLHVPTDDPEILATAFQILEDWAHGIAFDEEDVKKERLVILEELRQSKGVGSRMRDELAPLLFKDSRYLERPPIGKESVLETALPDALRRFYKDWYRPDLMAVVAVGDFDPKDIEKKIHRHFAHLENPENPRPRETYPVPDFQGTRFVATTDPALTATGVTLFYKHEVASSQNPIDDARQELAEMFYSGMLNNRLSEVALKASPPFVDASCGKSELVRAKETYTLSAVLKENKTRQGIEALMREAERVKRYGFTLPEIERGKQDFLRLVDVIYQERDKIDSANFINDYIEHFFTGGPLVDIEYLCQLARDLISELTLEEVGQQADRWIRDDNRVILLEAPEGVQLPTEKEVLAMLDQVEASEIKPYVEDFVHRELITEKPKPSKIVADNYIEDLNVTEWTLANGVRVVLKPTDFQNDQIHFTAFSPGGHSLYSDGDYVAASTAGGFIVQGGLGDFDRINLGKWLTGKAVDLSIYIGALEEGLFGGASTADIETLFQMIHLAFVAPRRDPVAFQSAREKMKEGLRNRSPGQEFGELIQTEMTRHHRRRQPFSKRTLDEMNLERSFEIYLDRFSDAGDFTFILVGNLSPDQIRPLARTYLGSLPSSGRKETWKDVDLHPPAGIVKQAIHRESEDKSTVALFFTGPFTWTLESQHVLGSLGVMLQIRLQERLREDLGGTYSVGVNAGCYNEYCFRTPQSEYEISVSFGCAPEKVDDLIAAVFEEIEHLKEEGPGPGDLRNLVARQRRSLEIGLKDNWFWLQSLASCYSFGDDPLSILQVGELIGTVSAEDVRKAAKAYLNTGNYAQFVLRPE